MSDWEIVSDNDQSKSDSSEWEIVQSVPNSIKSRPQESLGSSLTMAIPRVGEDLYRGAMSIAKKIPGLYESAKTELPGIIDLMRQNTRNNLNQFMPGQQQKMQDMNPIQKQLLAGLAEQGQNVFNTPHDILNYAANRLNLFPKDWNEKVQMARMPDSLQDINMLFGSPERHGESLARGITKNALTLIPTGKAVSALNPMNLTAKNIASDVLRTEKKQIASHTNRYNRIWDEAQNSGFNQVPVDTKLLSDNLSMIEKYKTPREYQSLEDFILQPTLQNAQKAQSDMGQIHRKLEEKSRSSSLTSEERTLYHAAKDSEKHIESNMFKDHLGNINSNLQNKYQKLTKSYRENVVPYKYNPAIQAYKNKEMLAHELVNSLSRGEFAAKKGSAHRGIGIRNKLAPIATGAGLIGGASWLYNQMFGNEPPPQQ